MEFLLWQFSSHFSFISVDFAPRACFILIGERSKHFHIWIFPNQKWMQERFGYGLQYLRDINAYARQNSSEENIEKVIQTVEEIKRYIGSEN